MFLQNHGSLALLANHVTVSCSAARVQRQIVPSTEAGVLSAGTRPPPPPAPRLLRQDISFRRRFCPFPMVYQPPVSLIVPSHALAGGSEPAVWDKSLAGFNPSGPHDCDYHEPCLTLCGVCTQGDHSLRSVTTRAQSQVPVRSNAV